MLPDNFAPKKENGTLNLIVTIKNIIRAAT